MKNLLRIIRGNDVLVIDDGSYDGTRSIAEKFGANVLAHEERLGKAASLADGISYALQNSFDLVVEIGSDAIPEPDALRKIIARLDQSSVGAVSCRQIPIGRNTLAYHIDEIIWAVLAEGKSLQMQTRRSSHLGAVMFGFKPSLVDSVAGSVNDDEQVGLSISKKGYRIEFVDDAVAYFDASSCIGHILERRKRMYFGHMKFLETTAPSMELSTSLVAITRIIAKKPKRLGLILPTLILDLFARALAWKDCRTPSNFGKYSRWVTTYAKDNSLVIRNSSA